ncbi:MAG: type II secretion system F family protein [Bacillota bacterium]|nr:type II secretion system F family protein [Bacillota bacterium]
MEMIYLAAVFMFLLTWTVLAAALFTLLYKERPVEKLKYYDEDYTVREKFENNNKGKISPLKILAALIPSKAMGEKRTRKLEAELIKADIPITPEELLVIRVLSSVSLSFLGFALFKDILIALMVFAFVWSLPRFIISKRKKERIKQFNYQLSEGILIISNSLKAGYSFLQSIAVVVEETKDPFSKEFKKMLKEMSLGISEEDALRNLHGRMVSENLSLIVNAILIQKDIGGNLSEILDNIAETIRERQKIQGELKTLTAQGRLSGIIVMLIPVFLGITIYLFNREYMLLLFKSPVGLGMIGAAVFNEFVGFFMIRKIVRVDM